MSDYVRFDLPPRGPAGKRSMGEVLRAHFNYERVSMIRVVLIHLLVPVGLLPWIAAGWPSLLARRLVAGGLALWAVMVIGVVVSAALEYKWYREETRCLKESGGSREDS